MTAHHLYIDKAALVESLAAFQNVLDVTSAAGAPTKMNFNATPSIDNYAAVDVANDQYIAPVTGVYFLQAYVSCLTLVAGDTLSGAIYVNGATTMGAGAEMCAMNNLTMGFTLVTCVSLNKGDTVAVYAWQDNGTNKNVYGYVGVQQLSINH